MSEFQQVINHIHELHNGLEAEAATIPPHTTDPRLQQRLDEINGARQAIWQLALWIQDQRDEDEREHTLTAAGRRVLELERENEQLTLALAEARVERGALWALVGDSEALEAEAAALRALAAEADAPRQADNDARPAEPCKGLGVYARELKARKTALSGRPFPPKFITTYYPDGRWLTNQRNPLYATHITKHVVNGAWQPLNKGFKPSGMGRLFARPIRRAALNVERAQKDAL